MTLLSSIPTVEEVDYAAELTELTAVERFAQRHASETGPVQARYYRDLIPASPPGPGQQYAFEVDLDACTGCKACVAACHSLNGLDDGEAWRSVTLLTSAESRRRQTVTAACHHCVDPACLKGCPVDAYEKDPITGIVSHLDDQCIGCSYCTLTCPYDVPVFNHSRGIVRKCDMCKDRLEEGEAPACVQSCPNEAITIRIVDVASVGAADALYPGAPPSALTRPTTVYRTAHQERAAEAQSRPTGAPHPALAVMLVLTQLAVGAFVVDLVVRPGGSFEAAMAVIVGMIALGASVLHLGRPQYCYRAVIGLGHSWLSREVVAFGGFTGLAAAYAVWPARWLGLIAAGVGIAGVACSVMIYVVTRRTAWRWWSVAAKFALTGAACGMAAVVWAAAISGRHVTVGPFICAAVVLKLGLEAPGLSRGDSKRIACGVAGAALIMSGNTAALTLGVVALVTGELLERLRFFTTAGRPA